MTQAALPKEVIVYCNEKGREPFTGWLYALKDQKARRDILKRIGRLEQGLYGDCKPVGEGVSELRFFTGPGYRVHFGEDGGRLVILLCGGDKRTQSRDIETAKEYWKEYKYAKTHP